MFQPCITDILNIFVYAYTCYFTDLKHGMSMEFIVSYSKERNSYNL